MSEIAWLLERAHRLKLAAKEAKKRAADAGATTASLWKQLDETSFHLAHSETGTAGEQRPDVKARVEARRKELDEQIKQLTSKLEAAKEHSTRATEFEIATSAIFERCSHWLDTHAQGDVAFERIDIPTEGDPQACLARLDAEIAKLDAEKERICSAPTARADIEHAVRAHIASLRGEPVVEVDAQGRVEIVLPGMKKQVDQAYFPVRALTPKALLACLLWLDGDRIQQRLLELVDRIPINKDALTADAKQRRLHEISAQREVLLYEAGATVRHAVETGTPVPISKLLTAEHLLGVRVRPALAVVA